MREALDRADAHGARVARATAELHVGLSEIDTESGDLESAKRHLETAAALTDRAAMNESRFRWFVAMGILARAQGDPEEAVQLLDQASQLYRPGFYPDVRPIAAIKARIWIAQGKLSEAADWARERRVSATDDARYLSEFDHLTLVRLLLARHRAHRDAGALDQAAGLLDRLYAAAETAERAGSLLEIRVLQALVQDAQGRRTQALEHSGPSLGAGARTGEPRPALPGRGRAHAEPAAGRRRCWRRWRPGGTPAPPRHISRCPASRRRAARGADGGESLSERELQVLRLLDSELTGPEIARQLFVSHNTVRTHTKHIFTKLDVTNRRAAVLRARERGLI